MWATLFSVFTTVFLAEMGDKTQVATLLFVSDRNVSPWVVFAGASLALTTAAGIGVLVGAEIGRLVSRSMLRIVAGIGFIAIGLWTLLAR